MNLWRLKNKQMLPDKYKVEEREGELYIYDSRDVTYSQEQGEHIVTEWVSIDEELSCDLDEMR